MHILKTLCSLLQKILRLRFGIGRPADRSAVADYVLEKFSSAEKAMLPQLLDDCIDLVLKRIKQETGVRIKEDSVK